MKEILTSKNESIFVDSKFYKTLIKSSWCITKQGYAVGRVQDKIWRMHRYIMHLSGKNIFKKEIDHKNRNKLDNRLRNLRFCTDSQNRWNSDKTKNNKSGYKGVYWDNYGNRWRAKISVNRKRIYLGSFKNKRDALTAYNKASFKYHKEFRFNNVTSKSSKEKTD